MYQNRSINYRWIERSTTHLRKKHIAQQESEKQADRQPQYTRQQGNDKVFTHDLSHQFSTCTSKGTTYTYLRYATTQAAVCHAAQVDGRHNK